MLLAYLLPSLLSVIAVQMWFEPGTAIAGGDLAPPLAPAADYTSHWSHLAAGEGSPAYEIVGLPYAVWLDVWTSLGATEELAQRIWLSAFFAGGAAAVVFLTFGFTASAAAAGSAGLLASFNAYRLTTAPDTIPMAAIIVAALLGGFVVRVALRPERKTSLVGFALASTGLGYVMANPPHVVLVVLWVAACAAIALAAEPAAAPRVFTFLARATPLALLLNLWWIVPAWLTITAPSFGDQFAAAGVEEWAWTHARATLANALTLNTTWAWSYPEYFPYADRLSDHPFDFLKVFLPLLAAVGVVLARGRERRIAIGLALVALAAVLLTTGLGGPIPTINRWLYDHIPGYWLFRDPTKILLLVLLPISVLGGLAVNGLFAVGRRSVTPVLAVGLVAGALIYVHPVFTGEVIAGERPPLPSAHVHVPRAWRLAAATLNAQPDAGKVLILPRSDFYQVPTTWGYYGTPFARSIIRRPVLESYPGGYFRPAGSVSSLEESIESDLVSGRPSDVRKKLSALGVQFVLLRRDIDGDFPNRQITPPKVLARALTRVHGVRTIRSFGMLDLYRVEGTSRNDEVFATRPTFYAGSSDALAAAVSGVAEKPGLVAEKESQRSLAEAGVRPTRLLVFEENKVRRMAVKRQGRTLLVRLDDPFHVLLSGRKLSGGYSEEIAVPIAPATSVVLTAGSTVASLRPPESRWANLGLVWLRKGESVSVWRAVGGRSIHPASGEDVGDCNPFDNRSLKEVGIRARVVAPVGRPTLRLSAWAHSACVTFPLLRQRSPDLYTVRFRYRQKQGSPARACIWQTGVGRCAPAPDLRPSRQWQTFEATVRPDPRATALTLFLYADGRGQGPATVTEYRGIRLQQYRGAAVPEYELGRTHVLPAQSLFRGALSITSRPLAAPLNLSKVGPAGDCNDYDARSPREVGLMARLPVRSGRRVLQLAARDHSACVDFAVTPFRGGVSEYRVRLEYRGVAGSAPRACLWQEGPDRCISFSELQSDGKWHVLDRTVRLDTNVRALALFLYADGTGIGRTVTEYRDVHVEPVSSVAILGFTKGQPLPRIEAHRDKSWKFHVKVHEARAPFLLATSEAYAPGWKASADGRQASALRHVQVNGYANGWLVPWKGSYELTLEYGPERYARAARWLSLIGLIGVLGWIGLRCARWFLVRPEWTGRKREQAFRSLSTGDHVRDSGGRA